MNNSSQVIERRIADHQVFSKLARATTFWRRYIVRPLIHLLKQAVAPTPSPRPMNLALLIDGENTSPHMLPFVLSQIAKYGYISFRRIYGDWEQPAMKPWNDLCHQYSLQPVHQVSLKGKNTTDIALVIDTMDLLYQQQIDGFCLVASDSDYLPLILRLRAAARLVIVFGKLEASKDIHEASTVFIPFPQPTVNGKTAAVIPETTPPLPQPKPQSPVPQQSSSPKSLNENKKQLRSLLKTAYEHAPKDDTDGWILISVFGHSLKKIDSTFTPKRYGYVQLNQLIKTYSDMFEVQKTSKGQYKLRLRTQK